MNQGDYLESNQDKGSEMIKVITLGNHLQQLDDFIDKINESDIQSLLGTSNTDSVRKALAITKFIQLTGNCLFSARNLPKLREYQNLIRLLILNSEALEVNGQTVSEVWENLKIDLTTEFGLSVVSVSRSLVKAKEVKYSVFIHTLFDSLIKILISKSCSSRLMDYLNEDHIEIDYSAETAALLRQIREKLHYLKQIYSNITKNFFHEALLWVIFAEPEKIDFLETLEILSLQPDDQDLLESLIQILDNRQIKRNFSQLQFIFECYLELESQESVVIKLMEMWQDLEGFIEENIKKTAITIAYSRLILGELVNLKVIRAFIKILNLQNSDHQNPNLDRFEVKCLVQILLNDLRKKFPKYTLNQVFSEILKKLKDKNINLENIEVCAIFFDSYFNTSIQALDEERKAQISNNPSANEEQMLEGSVIKKITTPQQDLLLYTVVLSQRSGGRVKIPRLENNLSYAEWFKKSKMFELLLANTDLPLVLLNNYKIFDEKRKNYRPSKAVRLVLYFVDGSGMIGSPGDPKGGLSEVVSFNINFPISTLNQAPCLSQQDAEFLENLGGQAKVPLEILIEIHDHHPESVNINKFDLPSSASSYANSEFNFNLDKSDCFSPRNREVDSSIKVMFFEPPHACDNDYGACYLRFILFNKDPEFYNTHKDLIEEFFSLVDLIDVYGGSPPISGDSEDEKLNKICSFMSIPWIAMPIIYAVTVNRSLLNTMGNFNVVLEKSYEIFKTFIVFVSCRDIFSTNSLESLQKEIFEINETEAARTFVYIYLMSYWQALRVIGISSEEVNMFQKNLFKNILEILNLSDEETDEPENNEIFTYHKFQSPLGEVCLVIIEGQEKNYSRLKALSDGGNFFLLKKSVLEVKDYRGANRGNWTKGVLNPTNFEFQLLNQVTNYLASAFMCLYNHELYTNLVIRGGAIGGSREVGTPGDDKVVINCFLMAFSLLKYLTPGDMNLANPQNMTPPHKLVKMIFKKMIFKEDDSIEEELLRQLIELYKT